MCYWLRVFCKWTLQKLKEFCPLCIISEQLLVPEQSESVLQEKPTEQIVEALSEEMSHAVDADQTPVTNETTQD